MLRRAFDWEFRSREDGHIVVAQLPNLPLWIFLVATGVDRVLEPAGDTATVIRTVATVGLAWWAGDEVLRGVNPFRRALGAVVAALLLRRLL